MKLLVCYSVYYNREIYHFGKILLNIQSMSKLLVIITKEALVATEVEFRKKGIDPNNAEVIVTGVSEMSAETFLILNS